MTKLLERLEAHYEVEDVEMGKVYRWCPERELFSNAPAVRH